MLILVEEPYGDAPEEIGDEAPIGCCLWPNIYIDPTVYYKEHVITYVEKGIKVYGKWITEHIVRLKYRNQVEPTQSIHRYQNQGFRVIFQLLLHFIGWAKVEDSRNDGAFDIALSGFLVETRDVPFPSIGHCIINPEEIVINEQVNQSYPETQNGRLENVPLDLTILVECFRECFDRRLEQRIKELHIHKVVE